MDYRRAQTPGGTYFFTVNLADRDSDTLVRHIEDAAHGDDHSPEGAPVQTLGHGRSARNICTRSGAFLRATPTSLSAGR
jgi:hypothetical protein